MCHYRRHLKGSLLSVYEYAVAAAKPPDKIFCASIATTCDATGYYHKTVSVALRRLTERGWLVKEDRNRLLAKTGTFQPNWYQVIDHDQRAVDHPEECRPTDRGVVLPPRQNTATLKPASTVVQKPSMTVVQKPTHIVRKNRKKEQEEVTPLAVSLQEYTSKTWTDRFKQKPTWGKKDRVALEEFLKTHSQVTTEEFQGRWQRYLEDPDSFLKKLGYSLWYFVSKFDSYIGALRPDAPHLIFDGQERARHRAPVPD
jgi:hypothetical protein